MSDNSIPLFQDSQNIKIFQKLAFEYVERGCQNISMKSLCESFNLNENELHKQFGSQEELACKTIQYLKEIYINPLEKMTEEPIAAPTKFRLLSKQLTQLLKDNPVLLAPISLCFTESTDIRYTLKNYFRDWSDLFLNCGDYLESSLLPKRTLAMLVGVSFLYHLFNDNNYLTVLDDYFSSNDL